MNLDGATKVMVGNIPATAIYMGASKVWPKASDATPIQFHFDHPYELKLVPSMTLNSNRVYEGPVALPIPPIIIQDARKGWWLGTSSISDSLNAKISPVSGGVGWNISDPNYRHLTSQDAITQFAGHTIRVTVDNSGFVSLIEVVA